MIQTEGVKGEFLEYRERPLVRQDNEIYYGNLDDKYHIYMMIMSEKEDAKTKESIADKVLVQLRAKGAVMPEKQFLATGLADAFETAAAWLERFNK